MDKITLQTSSGFYQTTTYQFDMTLRALTGITVGALKAQLAEHTECDYSDVYSMSALIIIAADTHLVV
jgi:hypothetical protein